MGVSKRWKNGSVQGVEEWVRPRGGRVGVSKEWRNVCINYFQFLMKYLSYTSCLLFHIISYCFCCLLGGDVFKGARAYMGV